MRGMKRNQSNLLTKFLTIFIKFLLNIYGLISMSRKILL